MVKIETVDDEAFTNPQAGPTDDDDNDSDYTDTDSSLSTTSLPSKTSASYPDETPLERLLALRDMIPPATRAQIAASVSTASGYVATGLRWGGKGVWALSTSALLIGVPFALAFMDEVAAQEEERAIRMQQGVNDVVAPGAAVGGQGGQGDGRAKAAL
ncbi:MAG: mitochondrial import receptor protein [Piccolia ochrophora]|nr:MAG: mitochondrial import receptor protein [Piccolia ochrophora]